MNDSPPEPPPSGNRITTLVDHQREGRFIIAFCPICDHAEEAEDDGLGREQTVSVSVAKIKLHISHRHRARPARVKITDIRAPGAV